MPYQSIFAPGLFDGQVVIVTGGGSGIGRCAAHELARLGAHVVLVGRKAEKLQAVQVEIEADGGQASCHACDIRAEPAVALLVQQVLAAHGRIDALVNNAGVLETQMRLDSMDAARVRRVLDANVVGPLLCCREAVRRMSTRHGGQGGAIVNVSSVAALTGSPGEYVDYAASKGALDTLTRGLAQEVAQEGIRVNGVRPGFIYTGMHASGGEPGRVDRVKAFVPMRRGGQPEEVAQAIVWLLSDEASYSTGGFIDVAGGR